MSSEHRVLEWLKRLGSETGAFEIRHFESDRRAASPFDRMRWDYVVDLALKPFGFPMQLYVEFRDQITPQIALEVLPRLKVASGGGIPLLCARTVSKRLAEMCKEADVGFLDQAGNCRLTGPGLFIFVGGRSASGGRVKSKLNPFSTKSSRIVRVMLEKPEYSWQVQELANEANVSMGLVSKVKDELLVNALLVQDGKRVRIKNPKDLLTEWSEHYQAQGEDHSFYVMGKAKDIEERVGVLCEQKGYRYGLTEFSAAWRLAPMVRYERSTVCLAKGNGPLILEEIQDSLKAKRVESGSNLKLRLAPDDYVFYGEKKHDGLNLVSPIQLYLDLMKIKARGEEAAKEIYERHLSQKFEHAIDYPWEIER